MKKIVLVAVMATFSLGAFAQNAEKARFGDNTFISVGAGVNHLITGKDIAIRPLLRGLQVNPAVDFSIGKWFMPQIGLRLQYAGIQASGWTLDSTNPFVTGDLNSKTGNYLYKFGFHQVHLDFMLNASDTDSYKPDRLWDCVIFAGPGVAFAVKDGHRNISLAINAGLLNKIRITNEVDINLEFRAAGVRKGFNGSNPDSMFEIMGSVTVGASYNFGRGKGWSKYE